MLPTSPAGAPLANARAPPRAASSMRSCVTPAADPASRSASSRTTEGSATANSAVTAPRHPGSAAVPRRGPFPRRAGPVSWQCKRRPMRFRRNPRTSSLRMMNTRSPANPTAARVAMAYSAVAIPACAEGGPGAATPLQREQRSWHRGRSRTPLQRRPPPDLCDSQRGFPGYGHLLSFHGTPAGSPAASTLPARDLGGKSPTSAKWKTCPGPAPWRAVEEKPGEVTSPPRRVRRRPADSPGSAGISPGSSPRSTGTTPRHTNAGREHRPSGTTSFTPSAAARCSAALFRSRRSRAAWA